MAMAASDGYVLEELLAKFSNVGFDGSIALEELAGVLQSLHVATPRLLASMPQEVCAGHNGQVDLRGFLSWLLDLSQRDGGTNRECPAPGRFLPLIPVGSKKDSNDENMAAFRSGALRHKPPTFEFFDPVENESCQVDIREIKLPRSTQTHEVCYEPVTQCVFVSQMSNCVLVRIPLDANGFLFEDQDAWKIGQCNDKGDGIEGIHNISLSKSHPGCLWISLQYANELLLVDVTPKHTMLVRQIIQVPTLFTNPETSATVHIGGPHCMRECPVTGDIWAGMKGALKNAPCRERKRKETGRSACCDPEQLKGNMAELRKCGFDTPIPEGWAVWRLTPSKYDPQAEDGAKGGTLYPCLESPPMLDFDSCGNCYVAQDGVDTMLFIDRTTGTCEQLAIPFPAGGSTDLRITGPAIGVAPNGSIWMSLLGSYNALVRIDPDDNNKRTLYEFGGPKWCKTIRLIHLTFSAADDKDTHNRIYALATDLLDDQAVNAVVILRFDDTWTHCLGRRIIPLPTQDCACHRVLFIDRDHLPTPSRSIVITELASSKLLQIMVKNIVDVSLLEKTIITDSDGFEVHRYVTREDCEIEARGAAC